MICQHDFQPDCNNKFDGHGHCIICGEWKPFMFMNEKIARAKALAQKAHEGQVRKYEPLPYIKHPEDVYILVSWLLEKEVIVDKDSEIDMCCASWLHDVLEDCPQIKEEEIVDAVGSRVLSLIKELTNPSKGANAPRAVRKQMDRDHLSTVRKEAKIIKLADRICNLRDMAQAPKDFMRLYVAESRALLEVLRGTNKTLESMLEDIIKSYESQSI